MSEKRDAKTMRSTVLVGASICFVVFGLAFLAKGDSEKKLAVRDLEAIPSYQCVAVVPLKASIGEPVEFKGAVAELEKTIIEPTGGTYTLKNGITLNVPPGAVSQSTAVGIRRIGKDEAEPILQSYGNTMKYFLAGFSGTPQTFNLPIKVSLPSERLLNTADLPLPFIVDLDSQIYCSGTPIPIPYPSMTKASDMNATQAETEVVEYYYDPESGNKITITVTDFTAGNRDEVIAAVKDLINRPGSADCTKNPIPCDCLGLKVKAWAKDLLSDGECYFTQEKGSVEYSTCPGKPIFSWEADEKHLAVIHHDIRGIRDAGRLEMKIGESEGFTWWLEDGRGTIFHPPTLKANIKDETVIRPVFWHQDLGQGLFTANACGETEVFIEAGCENFKRLAIKVVSAATAIRIEPPSRVLSVGETLILKVFDQDDKPVSANCLGWIIPSGGIISFDPGTLTVKGVAVGDVTLSATCAGASSPVSIKVTPTYFGEITDPAGDLLPCQWTEYDIVYGSIKVEKDLVTIRVEFSPPHDTMGQLQILIDSDTSPSPVTYDLLIEFWGHTFASISPIGRGDLMVSVPCIKDAKGYTLILNQGIVGFYFRELFFRILANCLYTCVDYAPDMDLPGGEVKLIK